MSVEMAVIPAPYDEGDYLMSKIRHRCVDDAGCWVWTGSAQKGVMPIINIGGNVMAVRRAVWIAFNGEIPAGLEIVRTCESVLCVNPDHLKQMTKSGRRRMVATLRGDKPTSAKMIAANRAGQAKLDMEKARYIRATDERSDVLAERFGVSTTTINNVRAYRAWPEANPFAGLGAR